jgi:hypothetical protein
LPGGQDFDAERVRREFTRPRQACQSLLWTRTPETATINAAFTAETFRIKL